MTTPQVWVSTTSGDIQYDGQGPGPHWQLVGEIDSSAESNFYTHIQVQLGLRSTTRGPAEFYLDGDPESPWVQADDHPPFWVAIDPWGEMRTHYHGAKPTYYVAKAKSVPLARRAPEGHPGRAVRPIKVPIKLQRSGGVTFTRWVLEPD